MGVGGGGEEKEGEGDIEEGSSAAEATAIASDTLGHRTEGLHVRVKRAGKPGDARERGIRKQKRENMVRDG